MLKFNKVLNSKIVSLIIACVFLLNNTAYGIDLPKKSLLRKPLDFNGTGVARYLEIIKRTELSPMLTLDMTRARFLNLFLLATVGSVLGFGLPGCSTTPMNPIEARDALIKRLFTEENNPNVKFNITQAIAGSNDQRVTDAFIRYLQDPRFIGEDLYMSRYAAVYYLGVREDSRIVSVFGEVLKRDNSWLARETAAIELARFKDPIAIDSLAWALLNDSHQDVRASAARSLIKIKDPRAADALAMGLKDPVWLVRALSEVALLDLGYSQEKIEELKKNSGRSASAKKLSGNTENNRLASNMDVSAEQLHRDLLTLPFGDLYFSWGRASNRDLAAQKLPQPNVMFVRPEQFAEIEPFLFQALFFEAAVRSMTKEYNRLYQEIRALEKEGEPSAERLSQKKEELRVFLAKAEKDGFYDVLAPGIAPILSRKVWVVVERPEEAIRVREMVLHFFLGGGGREYFLNLLHKGGYGEAISQEMADEFVRQRSFVFPGALFNKASEKEILERMDKIMTIVVLPQGSTATIKDVAVTHTSDAWEFSSQDQTQRVRKSDIESFKMDPSEWQLSEKRGLEEMLEYSLKGGTWFKAGGNGDPTPFSAGQDYTNIIIAHRGQLLLIDPSRQTIFNIKKMGLWGMVGGIYLSHVHNDHIGGVVDMLYGAMSGKESGRRIPLIASRLILAQTHDYLSVMMANNLRASGKTFKDIFESTFDAVGPDSINGDIEMFKDIAGGLTLETKRTFGHPLPTFGLKISNGSATLGYLVDSTMPSLSSPRYKDFVEFFGNVDMLIAENGVPGVHITPAELTAAFGNLVAAGALYTVHAAGPQNTMGLQRLETYTPVRLMARKARVDEKLDINALLSELGIGFSNELRQNITRSGEIIELNKGDRIFKEGESISEHPYVYLVLRGVVNVDGVGNVGPRALIGEMAVFNRYINPDLLRGSSLELYQGVLRSLTDQAVILEQAIDGKVYYVFRKTSADDIEKALSGQPPETLEKALALLANTIRFPPRSKTVVAGEGTVLLRLDYREFEKIYAQQIPELRTLMDERIWQDQAIAGNFQPLYTGFSNPPISIGTHMDVHISSRILPPTVLKVNKPDAGPDELKMIWDGFEAAGNLGGLAVPTTFMDTRGIGEGFVYFSAGKEQRAKVAAAQPQVITLDEHLQSLVDQGDMDQAKGVLRDLRRVIIEMFSRGCVDMDQPAKIVMNFAWWQGRAHIFDFSLLSKNRQDAVSWVNRIDDTNRFLELILFTFHPDLARYWRDECHFEGSDFIVPGTGAFLFGHRLKHTSQEELALCPWMSQERARETFFRDEMAFAKADEKLSSAGIRPISYVWKDLIEENKIPMDGVIVEVAPGYETKIGDALALTGFRGTVILVEPDPGAASHIQEAYQRIMPKATVKVVVKLLQDVVIGEDIPDRVDALVANHPFDDMALSFAIGKTKTPFFSVEQKDGVSLTASARERYDAISDERYVQGILATIAVWKEVIQKLRPDCFIASQYPGRKLMLKGLTKRQESGFIVLEILRNFYEDYLREYLKVQYQDRSFGYQGDPMRWIIVRKPYSDLGQVLAAKPAAIDRLGKDIFVPQKARRLDPSEYEVVYADPAHFAKEGYKGDPRQQARDFAVVLDLNTPASSKTIETYADRQKDPTEIALGGNLGSGRAVYYGDKYNVMGVGKTTLCVSKIPSHSTGNMDIVGAFRRVVMSRWINHFTPRAGGHPVVIARKETARFSWDQNPVPLALLVRVDEGTLDRPSHVEYSPEISIDFMNTLAEYAKIDAEYFAYRMMMGAWSTGNYSLSGHIIDTETASFVKYRGPYTTASIKYKEDFFGYEGMGFIRILRQLADVKGIKDIDIEKEFYGERRRHLARCFLSLLGVSQELFPSILDKHQEQVLGLADQFERLAKKIAPQRTNLNLYQAVSDNNDPCLLDMSNLFRNLAELVGNPAERESRALDLLVRKTALDMVAPGRIYEPGSMHRGEVNDGEVFIKEHAVVTSNQLDGFLAETGNFIHGLFQLLEQLDSENCLPERTYWEARLQIMNQDFPSMWDLNNKLKYWTEEYRSGRINAATLSAEIEKLCQLPLYPTGEKVDLSDAPLLKYLDLSEQELRAVSQDVETVRYKAGETIISQGEDADSLFLLVQGTCRVMADGREVNRHINRGVIIGEAVVFQDDRKRTATVIAETDACLLRIDRDGVERIIAIRPQLRRILLNMLEQKNQGIDRKVLVLNMFEGVNPEDLRVFLADKARQERFNEGQAFIHQGIKSDGVYVLVKGSVDLKQSDRLGNKPIELTDVTLTQGLLGERSVILDQEAVCSVIAHENVETLFIPSDDFREFLGQQSQLLCNLMDRITNYGQSNAERKSTFSALKDRLSRSEALSSRGLNSSL